MLEILQTGDVLEQQHGIFAAEVEHRLSIKNGPVVRILRHAPEHAPETPLNQNVAADLMAVVHGRLIEQTADGHAHLFDIIVDNRCSVEFSKQRHNSSAR